MFNSFLYVYQRVFSSKILHCFAYPAVVCFALATWTLQYHSWKSSRGAFRHAAKASKTDLWEKSVKQKSEIGREKKIGKPIIKQFCEAWYIWYPKSQLCYQELVSQILKVWPTPKRHGLKWSKFEFRNLRPVIGGLDHLDLRISRHAQLMPHAHDSIYSPPAGH